MIGLGIFLIFLVLAGGAGIFYMVQRDKLIEQKKYEFDIKAVLKTEQKFELYKMQANFDLKRKEYTAKLYFSDNVKDIWGDNTNEKQYDLLAKSPKDLVDKLNAMVNAPEMELYDKKGKIKSKVKSK